MLSLRTTLPLLVLVACEPTAGSPPPSASDPTSEAGPGPRPVVRTCPLVPAATHVAFDPRVSLGEHDGVTWLFGHVGGDPALAHLGPDGTLALTPVPLPGVEAGAIEGSRIWLASAGPSARWLAFDISDPDRPIAGAIASLTTGATNDHPRALAVGARRALAILGAPGRLDLVLLDTATGTGVAAPHPLDLTFRPKHTSCGEDGCFVLAVDHVEDADPPTGVVVLRVLADGTRERELLDTATIGDPGVARHGDQFIVAWPTAQGVRLRALDRDGHPLARAVPVPWDSTRKLRELRLFHAEDAVVLAVGEEDRWSVGLVGPHGNPGPLRELPGATRRSLLAAPLADGLAWLNVGEAAPADGLPWNGSEGVFADDPSVLLRPWRADAVGGFLPTVGDPAPPTTLASVEGDGRGSLEPHLLTRRGAAAALLVPRGDAGSVLARSFTLLRAPCRAAAGQRAPLDPPGDEGCRDAPPDAGRPKP